MADLNYWAVIASVVAALVVSLTWYSLLGARIVGLSESYAAAERPPAWKVAVEVLRSLIVVLLLAGLADRLGISTWTGAGWLALALWIGFPAAILVGAVLWEGEPWRLAAIHVGDWLVKLVVIALIIGSWRP